jgi:hypothetical protein
MAVLELLFSTTDCQVWEMASVPGEQLRRFRSPQEVGAAFKLGVGPASAHLQLYSPSMGGRFRVRRLEFDRRRVKGPAWRQEGHGWGSIQLSFGGLHAGRITPSHTNHNSQRRASTWEASYAAELGRVADWNWTEVVRVSRAINRHIAKLATGEHGSRPILPSAWAAVAAGEGVCVI